MKKERDANDGFPHNTVVLLTLITKPGLGVLDPCFGIVVPNEGVIPLLPSPSDYQMLLTPLTPGVKPRVVESFLIFYSKNRILKWCSFFFNFMISKFVILYLTMS